MPTFADVGATYADLFWGGQLGTLGFIGSGQANADVVWTVELKTMAWPSPVGPPVFDDLDDIEFITATVVDELGSTGSAEVVTSVEKLGESTKARLRDGLRGPMELWIYRNGVQVYAGPLLAPRIEDRHITFTSTGLLTYLSWMALTTQFVRAQTDQVLAFAEIVDVYQSLDYGHWGLDTGGLGANGIRTNLQLLPTSPQTFDQVLEDLTGGAESFDVWADPATRRLVSMVPRRGSDLSSNVIIDDRQITSSSWSASYAPGQVATDVLVTAQTPGFGPVLAVAGDPTLRALAGRRTLVLSVPSVTTASEINAHAAQAVADYGTQVITLSQSLVPVDLPFGVVGAGDTVTIDQDFGLGPMSSSRRIKGAAVSVASVGERVALDFV